MRKTLTAPVAALVVCGSTQQAPAQDDRKVKEDFEFVEKLGTRRGYEAFRQTYLRGPYADLAWQRIKAMKQKDDPQERARPNWGDEIFVPRLLDRQRHR